MKSTTHIHSGSLIRRAKEALFSRLDDELLAIDAQAGFCYALNDTAGRVWELIETPMPVGAVCARLRDEYAVEEATCLREVTALLQEWSEAGLIEVSHETVD
jgi:hypothetical protein